VAGRGSRDQRGARYGKRAHNEEVILRKPREAESGCIVMRYAAREVSASTHLLSVGSTEACFERVAGDRAAAQG
jgi:hypothetical protein